VTVASDGGIREANTSCDSLLLGLSATTVKTAAAPLLNWDEILGSAAFDLKAVAAAAPKPPKLLLAPEWSNVGVSYNAVDSRLSASGPLFGLDLSTQAGGISYQAWRLESNSSFDVRSRAADIESCCRQGGCGEFFVTEVTAFSRFAYQYSSFSVDASGTYTVYKGAAALRSGSGSYSKKSIWLVKLRQVPAKAASLSALCPLTHLGSVEEQSVTPLVFRCPTKDLTIVGNNFIVESSTFADGTWRVTVRPNGSAAAGTVGDLTLTSSLFSGDSLRLGLVVSRRATSRSEPLPPVIPVPQTVVPTIMSPPSNCDTIESCAKDARRSFTFGGKHLEMQPLRE
jgi:hypothetical protein